MADWKAMAEDTDARNVARAIGMKMYQKGRNTFILCPGHALRLVKPDTNPTNAGITKESYYCFGCGCFVRTPDIICEYLGGDIKEAFKIVEDTLGGSELYAQTAPRRRYLSLTEEQMRALRLDPLYDGHVPFSDVLREAPDLASKLVRKRAREMETVYRELISCYETGLIYRP